MVRCSEVKAAHGWCLHEVVRQNSLEKLDVALREPNLELHCKDKMGTTPLYMSLQLHRSDDFIMRIIEAGCDVNNPEELSPLHWAINRSSVAVASELIKRGVDTNSQNIYEETPLQYAVGQSNLDGVSLLLYYGADVNIPDIGGVTPLMNSFRHSDEQMSRLLFPFCSNFSAVDNENQSIFHYALKAKSPLAVDLLEMGVDANCISNAGVFPLMFTLEDDNYKMFKLMWSKLNHEILLEGRCPFLMQFLNNCHFPLHQWLDCLYSMLTSPVACQLAERFERFHVCGMSFLSDLLFAFIGNQIELEDRMAVIYVLMGLGTTLQMQDFEITLRLYGFNHEMEALIYTGNFDCTSYQMEKLLPVTTFILVLEERVTPEFVFQLFANQIRLASDFQEIVAALEYFSLPEVNKRKLKRLCQTRFSENCQNIISDKLDRIPTMPSLLELSRNAVRKVIKDARKVQRPYQFYDAVKSLNVPKRLKDVLCFKTSLYRH